METHFIPCLGSPLVIDKCNLIFKGGKTADSQKKEGDNANLGLYLTNKIFSGGVISTKIEFTDVNSKSCAEIIVNYDPSTKYTLNAGIPKEFPFLSVRAYENGNWNYIAGAGEHDCALEKNMVYQLDVNLQGSEISLTCNGVEFVRANLPKQYPPSQIGLFFISEYDIIISDFSVKQKLPHAFVITQFSSPYNEVYMEVIRNICNELEVDVVRADEVQGPGLIIADVIRYIRDSSFVIADISPVNANVFYELGYAHGINKPAILIAERSTKLPFDVSPFRTLFYDNTIAGKPRLENGLREAIRAVLGKSR